MVKMFSHQWPSILIKMYIGNSYSCVFLFFNNGNIYALSFPFFYDIFSYQHNIPYSMGKTVPISSLSWCSFGIKMMHCYFSKAFQHFSIIVFYKVVTNNSFFLPYKHMYIQIADSMAWFFKIFVYIFWNRWIVKEI